jgi:hypothetical protein
MKTIDLIFDKIIAMGERERRVIALIFKRTL